MRCVRSCNRCNSESKRLIMSRTLSPTLQKYPTWEREATAVIEAVRKWAHLLHGRTFCLVTDRRSVAFMLDPLKGKKIKNNKILLWRRELGTFSYRVEHTHGVENMVPDALSRPSGVAAANSGDSFKVDSRPSRSFWHQTLKPFLETKNLPFSLDDVKSTCREWKICSELKPQFFKQAWETLVKATRSWERIAVDFDGPV